MAPVTSTASAKYPSQDAWSLKAILIVGLCFIINMADGLDVVILSYIAPAMAKDWGMDPDALGIVFSAGLFGMAIGGLAIAPLADRFGRRRVILLALALMSMGMIASGLVSTIAALMVARVIVGIGIGTVLAAMAALTAESAPDRHRSLAVGIVQAGYPLAAVFTGLAAAHLVPVWGWQPMLLVAGCGTLVMLPLAALVLPAATPAGEQRTAALSSIGALFSQEQRARTLLLWLAIFSSLMVLYFIVSWIPKLAIDAGLSQSNGIYAGALYNFGAFAGTILMSVLSLRIALHRLIPALMAGAVASMMIFGSVTMSVPATLLVAFLIGVTLQGGYNAMWPLAASIYQAENRATGIGWAVGIGRGGAVIGPALGGYLMAGGASLPALFATFSVPLLIAGLAASRLGVDRHPTQSSRDG